MTRIEKFENELKSLNFHLNALKSKEKTEDILIQVNKIETYIKGIKKEILK